VDETLGQRQQFSHRLDEPSAEGHDLLHGHVRLVLEAELLQVQHGYECLVDSLTVPPENVGELGD
jgi:hypothetical protein